MKTLKKKSNTVLSRSEFLEYSEKLEQHHALFYSFWKSSQIVFTDSIETAAVEFDEFGELLQFVFNPNFWNKLDPYERLFVICHEMLHVALNHGRRIKDGEDLQRSNVALDVVVNHLLIDKFGFKRDRLTILNTQACWRDTIESLKDSEASLSFEGYYVLLPKNLKIDLPIGVLDDHGGLSGMNSDGLKKLFDKMSESMSDEEKNSAYNALEEYLKDDESVKKKAGTSAGSFLFVAQKSEKKKKKWETVIKKWSKKYNRQESFDAYEQWTHLNRRFSELSDDLFLPSDYELEKKSEGRIQVCFFQDTSGSCRHLANRFFKAACSLNPKRFDIRMFCFDTRVYKTSLESRRLYGFGGTSFSCIEKYIQEHIKSESNSYPEAVFVITDGCGDIVNPEKPKNWYWFLTYDYDILIPEECNIYSLRHYE